MADHPPPPPNLSLRTWFRLVAAGLVLIVLAGVARLMSLEWEQFERSRQARQAVQKLRVTLVAAEMVSRERGPTNAALGDASAGANSVLRQRLTQARERTDAAVEACHAVLAAPSASESQAVRHALAQRDLNTLQQALRQARERVDQLIQSPPSERSSDDIRTGVQAMIDLVPRLAPAMTMFSDEAQQADPTLAPSVWGARMATELRENAGLLGSLFTPALTRQLPFTVAEQERIDQAKGRIDELRHLMVLRMESSPAADPIRVAHANMMKRYFGRAAQLLREVEDTGRIDGRFGMTPADFAARYVPEMDAIIDLRDAQLADAESSSDESGSRSRQSLIWLWGVTTLLLGGILFMFNLIRQRVVLPLAQAADALRGMGRGDFKVPLPTPHANDEIAEVIRGIEALRRQSQERIDLERERDKLIETLREQSTTDFLTGLPNRRAFFEAAQAELARAQRHGFGLVLLMMDIDHFKRVNDTLGHTAGDVALVALAGVLQQGMRQGDLAARLGGEEFVALLSHCTPQAGLLFAERLREAIQAEAIDVGAGQASVHLTVSIGLADSVTHGHDLDELLARADEALYRAKGAGRNRTEQAAPSV